MDVKSLMRKMGLEEAPKLARKAQELHRLCNLRFESAAFGIGEFAKIVLCIELACSTQQVSVDRQRAMRVSGLSDKAHARSLSALQNALGLRPHVSIRELAIQFGCVRLADVVQRNLTLYKQRFIAALPEGRRQTADFARPVFTAVAFYLTARRLKLKVDRQKVQDAVGAADVEFANVIASMLDTCHDVVGVEKKRGPHNTDGHKGGASCKRARHETGDEHGGGGGGGGEESGHGSDDRSTSGSDDDGSLDDEDGLEVPGVKPSRRRVKKKEYESWRTAVAEAKSTIAIATGRSTKQQTLAFATERT